MAAHGYSLLPTRSPSRGDGDPVSYPPQLEFEVIASQERVQRLQSLRLLWRVSLELAFLKSRGSKRELWRILLPLLGFCIVLLNLLAGWGVGLWLFHRACESSACESSGSLTIRRLSCFSDLAMLLGLLGASRLPSGTLWSDVVMMAIMGIYGICCSFPARPTDDLLDTDTLGTLCVDFYRMLVVIAFASSGVHLCAIASFLAISAMALPFLGAGDELPSLLAGFLAFGLVGVSHLDTLNLFHELQEVHSARANGLKNVGVQTREVSTAGAFGSERRTSAASGLLQHVARDQNTDTTPPHLITIGRAVQMGKEVEMDKDIEEAAKEFRDMEEILEPVENKAREAKASLPPYDSGIRGHEADSITHMMGAPANVTTEGSEKVQMATPDVFVWQASGDSGLAPISWLASSGTMVGPMSSLAYTVSASSGANAPQTFGPSHGRQALDVCDQGVQTEPIDTVVRCQRCLRAIPSPTSSNFSPGNSRTSRQASGRHVYKLLSKGLGRRSSGANPSANWSFMRTLGQLARRPQSSSSALDNEGIPPTGNIEIARLEELTEAEPLVSSFKVTESESISLSIEWAMKHWNLPRIAGSCCPWHTALLLARTAIEELVAQRCDPLWSSLTDWQCSECSCLNHVAAYRCDMCEESQPSYSRSSSDPASSIGIPKSDATLDSPAVDGQTGAPATHET